MFEKIVKEIRKEIMVTAYHGKTGHIASALSAVEIMTAFYFGGVLNYDKADPEYGDRDKLIVSKGHASLVLYSVLNKIGYITREELHSFCQPGSFLGGEPKYGDIPGIEATTGSLGHGLSFAVGVAVANKLDEKPGRVYVLLGDGECQEGAVWEAALSAAHYGLDNLTVVLDRNKLQAMGDTEDILKIEPLGQKWQSFGWEVKRADGHNVEELITVLEEDKANTRKNPRIIIADTIKGKGISFMEQVPIWHYRMPSEDEMEIVKKELGLTERDLQR